MSAVTSCGQVKAAVTAVSLAAGTIIGATSFTSTTYNAASLHTAASTMLPQAASGFAVSHFPTSSANRTAYTALPARRRGPAAKRPRPCRAHTRRTVREHGDRHAGPEPAGERSHRQHQIDAGAGHELTEALRGDLQHEQQRKAYGRADDPCCFLHRGSSHFRQPEHPLHPVQLPEQPPVFRCRSRCTTASAMSATSTRQTRIVARFIAAGPFSKILLPV